MVDRRQVLWGNVINAVAATVQYYPLFLVQQVCVDLRASFPEPSHSVASLFDPRLHSATAVLTVAWGPPTHEEWCPLMSSLQVELHGQVTAEQWSLASEATAWPYNVCKQDLQDTQQWGSHYVPLTRACYEVVQELATLRYYNISISSSNVSHHINFTCIEMVPYLK